jgi:hypothetical protein
MPNIESPSLDAASRQPLPPIPDTRCKNFEAAKDAAFRDDLVTNNGGEKNRGPIPGGAEPSGKGGPSNRATGVDGAGVSCGATWDVGGDGLRITGGQCGVTTHIDGPPGKGYGGGIKWGGSSPGQPQTGVKPGVATGDAHGNSVTTADDVKKAGSSSPTSTASSTCSTKSSTPEGLKWVDKNQDLKSAIPPAATPEINDLGPSTNEPEQKTDAAAQNDEARFGDDIAQRI